MIDINTLGVLYLVSGDSSISSIENLSGKTVYLPGKGTTPEYVLRYLISASGLSGEAVTLEFKSEASEVAAVLAEDPNAIGLLPQPFVTAAIAQNDSLSVVLDLTKVWDSLQEDGSNSVSRDRRFNRQQRVFSRTQRSCRYVFNGARGFDRLYCSRS